MFCGVEQIVLRPFTSLAVKSTQFIEMPLTVFVELVTLSPANPAATENVSRNAIQCDGVYRLTSSFCAIAWARPSFMQVQPELPVADVQEYSPDELLTRSRLLVPPPVPDCRNETS